MVELREERTEASSCSEGSLEVTAVPRGPYPATWIQLDGRFLHLICKVAYTVL